MRRRDESPDEGDRPTFLSLAGKDQASSLPDLQPAVEPHRLQDHGADLASSAVMSEGHADLAGWRR